jgi:Amt family ammonium transporter
MSKTSRTGAALAAVLMPLPAFAADAKIDAGNTAWMLTATALVLMMTIPGLALFYAGMVRKKNVLAMMMQCFAACSLVTILWMVVGYSLAFGDGNAVIGNFSRILLSGIGWDKPFTLGTGDSAVALTIPEVVFMMFQMTFAIITPALICGAFADRMKFSAMLWFSGAWLILVYAPIAHMVWHPNGWMFVLGALDFAGGTVVHINAGIAGLVAAIMIGKRRGYGHDNMAPYNLTLAVIGASMLWVGWFGFNAGSAAAADGRAGMAMAVTQIAAAGAALAWMFAEWGTRGKPSVLGIISGAVAGLVAITPASGFAMPGGALIIGVVSGLVCFWASTSLKRKLGFDDSLDVFGVHGVGGIVGALLTGVFAAGALSATSATPDGYQGLLEGNAGQVVTQAIAVIFTVVYTAVVSYVILKVVDATVGLRVSDEEERDGLDISLHGETVQ